jgi:hypothetical protein
MTTTPEELTVVLKSELDLCRMQGRATNRALLEEKREHKKTRDALQGVLDRLNELADEQEKMFCQEPPEERGEHGCNCCIIPPESIREAIEGEG